MVICWWVAYVVDYFLKAFTSDIICSGYVIGIKNHYLKSVILMIAFPSLFL